LFGIRNKHAKHRSLATNVQGYFVTTGLAKAMGEAL